VAKTAGALFPKRRAAAMKTPVFIVICRQMATNTSVAPAMT
jgi:hypothetical protein